MNSVAIRWSACVVSLLDAACLALIFLKPRLSSVPDIFGEPSISDTILLFGFVMYGFSLFILLVILLSPRIRIDVLDKFVLWLPLVVIAIYVALCTYELQSVLRGHI